MTSRDNAIIRVCMGIQRSCRILQDKGKNNRIDLPFLAVCITCVFMTFGGVCERFWQVLASLYSSLNSSYIFTWCLTQVSQTRNVGVRTVALTCDQAFFLKREREKNNARNNYKTNRQPPPNLNKLRCG